MDSSLLLVPGISNRRPKFGHVGFFRKDFVDSCLSRGHVKQSKKGLRARAISNVGGESEDQSDVALQETIEKSKKVLSMQKKLLQQVYSSSFSIGHLFCSGNFPTW